MKKEMTDISMHVIQGADTIISNSEKEKGNLWLNGIMGVVIGDALGCPVQFQTREEIALDPVTGMRGHGTYDMPVGTWTDDSSMTLAALISIRKYQEIRPEDIMYRFASWVTKGEYTPFGQAFDIGNGTMASVIRYLKDPDVKTCGGRTAQDNGNGSLMRIMPICLYCYQLQMAGLLSDVQAVRLIHRISGLTHNHLRAKMACGLYYFLLRQILSGEGDLPSRLQAGIDDGFAFYSRDEGNKRELSFYHRLADLSSFAACPADEIRSSGYVLDTLEAAVWSLLQTGSFSDALLKAVNLGDDMDTVGAVCGGLAGLYYGYEQIPAQWLQVIQRREWIESLCQNVLTEFRLFVNP